MLPASRKCWVVQAEIILHGWSVPLEKYRSADRVWRHVLLTAEADARRGQAGTWATAAPWMTDRSHEPTNSRIDD